MVICKICKEAVKYCDVHKGIVHQDGTLFKGKCNCPGEKHLSRFTYEGTISTVCPTWEEHIATPVFTREAQVPNAV